MDNVDFYIKRGDLSPAISATLKDKAGTPVNLTGKSVTFKMRSFLTGEMTVDAPAVIDPDPTTGRVSYDWQTADTGDPGYHYAEWEVELSPGVVQTFPTLGWHLIEIAGDLDNPLIDDTTFSAIRVLRRLVAEGSRDNYSDSLLAAMILSNGGDVNITAAQVWREKAAGYAGLVDVSESGSSRKMSQLFDRAIKQAEVFESVTSTGNASGPVRPSIGRIVRQP